MNRIIIFFMLALLGGACGLEDYTVPSIDSRQLAHVVGAAKTVFVKFYAPWCGHCKKMAPTWRELGAKYRPSEGIRVVQVDCTKHKDICSEHNIQGYPTLKLFQNGDLANSIVFRGTRNFESLDDFIIKHSDPAAFAKAHASAEASNPTSQTSPRIRDHLSIMGALLIVTFGFIAGLVIGFLAMYYIWPGKIYEAPKLFSNIVPKSGNDKSGEIHRNISNFDEFPKSELESLYDNFLHGVKLSPNRPCLAHRPIRADGTFGPFTWQTYHEVNDLITHFGAGLAHLEMLCDLDNMKVLGIYMKNCPEWFITEHATFTCKGTTIPLYDTLGVDTAEQIINQTSLKTIVCTSSELDKLITIKPQCKSLLNVVIAGTRDEETEIKAGKVGIKIYAFEEVVRAGVTHPRNPTPPKRADIATFNYTSGTTGTPKGVMLSHEAMLSNAAAISLFLQGTGINVFDQEAIYLSYLPLPHALERMALVLILGNGGQVGFFQGNKLKLLDDLRMLRPTLFISVPRLLNKIYDKITGATKESKMKSFIFNLALSAKKANLREGYLEHSFWDRVVFHKIRNNLGLDRCQIIVTGAAPAAPDVLDFMRVCFMCPVVEGYGQTECAAGAAISHPWDFSSGTVGGPLASCEIKLVSVAEMDYLVTDSMHGVIPCVGRGEICFRGPTLFSGYYNQCDKTKEVLDEDGWLHSGDIGMWTLDGKLKLIDRKKNIFKLSQGEYIAPEKIENLLVTSRFVAQSFVYGDSFHSHLVAIIVPDEEYVKTWQKNEPDDIGKDFKSLCATERLAIAILNDIHEVLRGAKLNSLEFPKKIHVCPDAFTVENDILTPTLKLKRNEAKKVFQAEIDAMYNASGDHIAGKTIKQE